MSQVYSEGIWKMVRKSADKTNSHVRLCQGKHLTLQQLVVLTNTDDVSVEFLADTWEISGDYCLMELVTHVTNKVGVHSIVAMPHSEMGLRGAKSTAEMRVALNPDEEYMIVEPIVGEGKEKKGGVNEKPVTPPPAPPSGQGEEESPFIPAILSDEDQEEYTPYTVNKRGMTADARKFHEDRKCAVLDLQHAVCKLISDFEQKYGLTFKSMTHQHTETQKMVSVKMEFEL